MTPTAHTRTPRPSGTRIPSADSGGAPASHRGRTESQQYVAAVIDVDELPPIGTRFQLGDEITLVQRRFLEVHGFLHFANVASRAEVDTVLAELDRVEAQWLAEKRTSVHGIPLFWGKGLAGQPFLQRFAFTSLFSPAISKLVTDPRFEPIRRLAGDDARIGEDEKDGVVVNRNLNVPGSAYPRLGWHTDGLRDLFYGRMPQQMLNVGLHLDDCDVSNGGLRLIPGSHTQGFRDMCFRKLYFLDHREDPEEIAVEVQAGDLTIHDGRLWHRVAASPKQGAESLRRVMYVPYQTGPHEPKSEASRMPGYHRLGRVMRWLKGARAPR
jgi:phytanoyl-CoA hydroxylase